MIGLITSALKALSGLLGIGKLIAIWQAKREAKQEDENTDLRATHEEQQRMDAEPQPSADDVKRSLRDGSF